MKTTSVKKTIAVSSALVVATLGMGASAHAHSANDNGNANGNGHSSSGHSKAGHSKAGHSHNGGSKGDSANQGNQGNQGNKGPGGSAGDSANQGTKGSGGSTGQTGNAGTTGTAANGGSKGDPAGNNGTVKIAPLGDFDGIPNNSPHQGCAFMVEWYGFDQGSDIISTVTFTQHAPTADVGMSVDGPSQVFVGGDPASGAGTDSGLDGRQEYVLSFDGAPHNQQGYHVKLTINTPHSLGADKKSKVFWVQGCETTPTSTTSPTDTSTGGPTDTPTVPGETASTPPEVEGTQATASNGAGSDQDNGIEVMGAQAHQPRAKANARASQGVVPSAVNAGEDAARFIARPVPLAVLILGGFLALLGLAIRRGKL